MLICPNIKQGLKAILNLFYFQEASRSLFGKERPILVWVELSDLTDKRML